MPPKKKAGMGKGLVISIVCRFAIAVNLSLLNYLGELTKIPVPEKGLQADQAWHKM